MPALRPFRQILPCLVGLLFTAPAWPQSPSAVEERLERLEKQNEELRRQTELLRQQNEKLLHLLDKPQADPVLVQPTSTEGEGGAPGKKEVRDIVEAYLRDKDAAAKKTEAAKKSAFQEVGSDLKFNSGWNNGLVFSNALGDFKMHVGGRINWDWYVFDQSLSLKTDPAIGPLDDGVLLRRGRLSTDGTIYEVFEWWMEFDFAGGGTAFDDLWFGVSQLPLVGNVRVGHIKVPQGLESITSSRFLTFMERGLPFEAFLQEYDPGFLVFNQALDQRLVWSAAFHRIAQSNFSDFGDGDYAITGRICGTPLYTNQGRCVLHLGASWQHREADAGIVNFASRPENRFPAGKPANFVGTGNILADNVDTFGFEAAAVWGPLSVQGEFFAANTNDAIFPATPAGTNRGDVTFTGGYVFLSYFLTGENRVYDRKQGRFDRIKPNENFFLVKAPEESGRRTHFGRGAWELAARYSYVDLSDSGINGGRLSDWTLALNWHLNPNMRVQLNYINADRSVTLPQQSGTADILGLRFHYDF